MPLNLILVIVKLYKYEDIINIVSQEFCQSGCSVFLIEAK